MIPSRYESLEWCIVGLINRESVQAVSAEMSFDDVAGQLSSEYKSDLCGDVDTQN